MHISDAAMLFRGVFCHCLLKEVPPVPEKQVSLDRAKCLPTLRTDWCGAKNSSLQQEQWVSSVRFPCQHRVSSMPASPVHEADRPRAYPSGCSPYRRMHQRGNNAVHNNRQVRR